MGHFQSSMVPNEPGLALSQVWLHGLAENNQAMYERFTDRARKVMQLANQEAQRFNHEYIGTEHILLGLVKEGIGRRRQCPEKPRHRPSQDPPGGREDRAGRARHGHHGQAAPDAPGQESHRILHRGGPQPQPQLRRHRTPAARPAARTGRRGRPGSDEPRPETGRRPRGSPEPAGAQHARSKKAAAAAAANGTASKGKSKTPALDSFGRDLTELARQGKLDPVIGRPTRSSASSRSSAAAPRTTPSCSARPASARPPSSKAWPSWSSTATSPNCCATAASSCSTWP